MIAEVLTLCSLWAAAGVAAAPEKTPLVAAATTPSPMPTETPVAEATAPEAEESSPAPEAPVSVEERLRRLEDANASLRAEIARIGKMPAPRAQSGGLPIFGDGRLRFLGYLDVGLFDAQGDGVAYARDVGGASHPEFSDVPWVFEGDPWSNPVNSQGDSADLGLDRTNIPRFDPIRSAGRPSFLVNNMNVGLLGSISDELLFETSLNFEPRAGSLGSSGDQIDVDLAYAQWTPFPGRDFHVFAGKFESTFGIEYRRRKSPDRFGVTPSLISRYTVGTPTGLKVRSEVFGKRLNVNAAVTNGTMTTEKFSHFFDEIDRNAGKTASARVGIAPIPAIDFEVGGSGLYGAQDLQSNDDETYRQFGADFRLALWDVELRAEWLRAEAGGDLRPDGVLTTAPWLRAEGWYVEAAWQVLPWLGVLGRGDFRHALLFADPNLYISDTARGTVGVRFDATPNLIAKVEYLRVMERSGPELEDDILTSSFIFRF